MSHLRSVLIAFLALLIVAPARAGHTPGWADFPVCPSSSGRLLTETWEEVLLLEAIRYLRLSRPQLEEIRPLAEAAEARLARLLPGEEAARGAIEKAARHGIDALMAGEPGAGQAGGTHAGVPARAPFRAAVHGSAALRARDAVREQRERAGSEIVDYVAPRLATILTREQIARAHLLLYGKPRRDQPASPALLHASSGFVLHSLADERPLSLRARYTAAAAMEADLARGRAKQAQLHALTQVAGRAEQKEQIQVYATLKSLEVDLARHDAAGAGAVTRGARGAHRAGALQGSGSGRRLAFDSGEMLTPERIMSEATPEELERTLRPLVRRMFLSPRLVPVLRERSGEMEGEGQEDEAQGSHGRHGHTPQVGPEGVGQARASHVEDLWEELLLLEAFRYARLSAGQLGRILPLARTAHERLGRLGTSEKRTFATLERTAVRHRQALLQGRAVPASQQADALRLREGLAERRRVAGEEIVSALTPQLARILSREQVSRVFLLALGKEWLEEGEPGSPALMDAAARFVLDPGERQGWKEAAVGQQLAGRYPPQVIEAVSAPHPTVRILWDVGSGDSLRSAGATRREMVFSYGVLAKAVKEPESPVLQAARRDRSALMERWDRLAELLVQEGSQEDLLAALRPFARRIFLSPRLLPALQERLGAGQR